MSKKIFTSICGGGFAGVETGIGALKAMDELGVISTELAGGSAGGLVASLYASFGSDASKLEKLIKETDVNTWFEFKPWQLLKKFVGLSNYCYDTTGLFNFLNEVITVRSAEMVKVSVCEVDKGFTKYTPILVPATPATTCATMSIPEACPPVRWNGILHCDGGVRNLLPTVPIKDKDNYDHIYYILCPDCGQENIKSSWTILGRLYHLVFDGVMKRELDQIKGDWEGLKNVTILDPPGTKTGGLLEWSDNFELLESSYEYTKQEIMKRKLLEDQQEEESK